MLEVVKVAKFSDSGATIRPEMMHQLNKKLVEKESELRKLRLLNIRSSNIIPHKSKIWLMQWELYILC
jgi:hypothetical protein